MGVEPWFRRCLRIGHGTGGLPGIEFGDHCVDILAGYRMAPVGGDVAKGQKNECSFLKAGMRKPGDSRAGVVCYHPVEVQNVQVQRAGGIDLPAYATELGFYPVQTLEQHWCTQERIDDDDGVDEPRLVRRRYRSTFIPRRLVKNRCANGSQCLDRRLASLQGRRVAGSRQIGADADDNHGDAPWSRGSGSGTLRRRGKGRPVFAVFDNIQAWIERRLDIRTYIKLN